MHAMPSPGLLGVDRESMGRRKGQASGRGNPSPRGPWGPGAREWAQPAWPSSRPREHHGWGMPCSSAVCSSAQHWRRSRGPVETSVQGRAWPLGAPVAALAAGRRQEPENALSPSARWGTRPACPRGRAPTRQLPSLPGAPPGMPRKPPPAPEGALQVSDSEAGTPSCALERWPGLCPQSPDPCWVPHMAHVAPGTPSGHVGPSVSSSPRPATRVGSLQRLHKGHREKQPCPANACRLHHSQIPAIAPVPPPQHAATLPLGPENSNTLGFLEQHSWVWNGTARCHGAWGPGWPERPCPHTRSAAEPPPTHGERHFSRHPGCSEGGPDVPS